MSPVSPGAVDAAFNIAVRCYERGDRGAAMRILQFLSIAAPTDVGVWRALAQCHDDVGEHDIAERLRWLTDFIREEAA